MLENDVDFDCDPLRSPNHRTRCYLRRYLSSAVATTLPRLGEALFQLARELLQRDGLHRSDQLALPAGQRQVTRGLQRTAQQVFPKLPVGQRSADHLVHRFLRHSRSPFLSADVLLTCAPQR